MRRYRILALDGGGVRGVLTAVVLERLLEVVPSLIDKADLLAGTSTGGILALGLARGLSPTQLRRLYEHKGQEIFHHSRRAFAADAGLGPAGHDNEALCRELKRSLGESIRLADLPKQVLVPAFDLDNEAADPTQRAWRPKLFHNFPGMTNDGEQRVYRVALYTSAAPMCFPSVDGFIDGGVYASNPSMVAVAHALGARHLTAGPTPGDLRVLSLGTGTVARYIPGRRHDWGCNHWLSAGLLDLINDASIAIADFQCRQLLQERYFRFAPVLPTSKFITLDESPRIPELIDYAERLNISELADWLEEIW